MATRALTDDIRPQLKAWFEYNLSAGCTLGQLKDTLVQSGYGETEVDRFLQAEAALWSRGGSGALFDADPVATPEEALARFWSRLEVLNRFNALSLGDRTVRLQVKNPRLGLYFIPGFLADEECEGLMQDAGPRLSDSAVLDEGRAMRVTTPSRSSRGAQIRRGSSDLVRQIESRIARLASLPACHGEGLQILHYRLGGEYRPHVDVFDPATVGGARALAANSQRLATVILYLCDVEAGGGTVFPDLSLEFAPLKGAALMFASIARDGALLQTSLHAGLPVASGEKWIATKWIRLTPQSAD